MRAADPATDEHAGTRRRQVLVVLLTLHSGYTDAIGFLVLGGAFTSVMTGNMVLLGLSSARGDVVLAEHTLAAIVCYIIGCVVGARLAGAAKPGQPVWPRHVSVALRVEIAVFATFAAGWWLSGSHPRGGVQLGLLAISALGLGIQSSAVQRFGVSGLSTTYMTGTLTTVVAKLTAGRGVRAVGASLTVLAGLISGAVVGALIARYGAAVLPVPQLVSLAAVLVAARAFNRTADRVAVTSAR